MKKYLIVLLCLGLCGCATVLYKEGVSPEQFKKDAYECRYQALSSSGDNIFLMRMMADECMEARGYRKQ